MLKYIADSGDLYSSEYEFIKKVKCPLEKKWDKLQKIDSLFDDPYNLIESITERHRYCDTCQSNVMNLDGLNADQIEGACLANPLICIHASLPHPAIEVESVSPVDALCQEVRTDLRIIHTARHLASMNDAVDKGFRLLIKPIIIDDNIREKLMVWQDEDGYVCTSADFRTGKGHIYWHNPYTSPLPFAAYIIPTGIKEGEKVYLVDLIEDKPGYGWNQGDRWRLKASEAIWTGGDMEVENKTYGEILG